MFRSVMNNRKVDVRRLQLFYFILFVLFISLLLYCACFSALGHSRNLAGIEVAKASGCRTCFDRTISSIAAAPSCIN